MPSRRKTWAVFLIVWVASAAYVYPFRLRGWIPHDEGVLALEAEYVYDGGLPHRDFPDIYTGGLSYWNALAFRLFGVRLSSLRLLFFLCFLGFVPALFAIASRFGGPLSAAAVTILAVVWSVPNYFSGSAAWYNLFFAAWGLLALLRHVETGRRRWLFLAGVLAGMSFLFKVSGVYLVAASLLFLVYREQQVSPYRTGPSQRWRLSGFLFFTTAGLALFLAALFLLIRKRLAETEFVYLLLPSATISGFLIWSEATQGGGPFARRFFRLLGLILPLIAGFLLPVLLFLIFFAVKGGIADLSRGLIGGTGAHLVRGSFLPPLGALWPALPYAVVLAAGSLRRFRFGGALLAAAAAVGAWALWRSGDSPDVYRKIWHSAFFLGVFVVLASFLRLADSHREAFWDAERRQKIFLVAAGVAMLSLVLFPLATSFYFFYFAPVVVLAIFALARSAKRPPWIVHLTAFSFYLLFALFRTNPSYIFYTGHHFENYRAPYVLDLPRAGGLRVAEKDARLYNRLIPLVQQKSGGKPIYAGPDAPEVHFLSGLPDAARHDRDAPRDPLQAPDELFRTLGEKDVRVAVLNRTPPLRRMRPAVAQRFEAFFPQSLQIEHFTVRWRD